MTMFPWIRLSRVPVPWMMVLTPSCCQERKRMCRRYSNLNEWGVEKRNGTSESTGVEPREVGDLLLPLTACVSLERSLDLPGLQLPALKARMVRVYPASHSAQAGGSTLSVQRGDHPALLHWHKSTYNRSALCSLLTIYFESSNKISEADFCSARDTY